MEEEDPGSWYPGHHQHQHQLKLLQAQKQNSSNELFNLGHEETLPVFMDEQTHMASDNRTIPATSYPELPQPYVGLSNEPPGWFYCLSRFRQSIAPTTNPMMLREKLPATTDAGSGCGPKKFLVFDQSGDQTTMIYSSGIESPVQCITSWNTKPHHGSSDLNRYVTGRKTDFVLDIGLSPTDANNAPNVQNEMQEDMHEDTEELNALLYSDDDSHSDYDYDYTEDDEEVTSTGHSPSTMTAHGKQESFVGSSTDEEVYSPIEHTRKRKLFNYCNDGIDGNYINVSSSLQDTASSVKPNNNSHYNYHDDDAESSCFDRRNFTLFKESIAAQSGNKKKKMRIEKIRETVCALRNIIPDAANGKNPVMVLDKAIDYLESLKVKAIALGLDDDAL